MISPVARPVEEGRVLATESVAQQPPIVITVGDLVPWQHVGTSPRSAADSAVGH